jgi:hypothetical protein
MKTTAAEAAKAIKAELKKVYPNVKFSVRSDNFAGGNSVDIDYTDGPKIEEIEAITDKYQYGHFNGMIDLYEYSNRRSDIPQAKFVTVSRSMSETTKQTLIEKLSKIWQGFNYEGYVESAGLYGYNVIYSEFVKMSF